MVDSIVEEALLGETCSTEGSAGSVLVKLNSAFFENVQKCSSLESFDRSFKNCKSNQERLKFCSKYFPFSEESSFYNKLLDYTKNEDISNKLRNRGNEFFKNRNFDLALRGYNLALCYAPTGAASTALSLSYANRSAVLFELGQLEFLENSLEDISSAMNLGYPEESKVKLERRREKATQRIASIREISTANIAAHSDPANQEFQKFEIFKKKLFQIQNPSNILPSAENFVEISSHPIRGRELFVTNDVQAGTTLVVEKPFTKILKNSLQWELSHCHNCFKPTFTGMPCTGCVFAMFCSVTCQESAMSTFHSYECPCWPYLHEAQTPRFVLQTFRLICQLGPTGLTTLFEDPEKLASWSYRTCPTEVYDPTSYTSVYQLVSHVKGHDDVGNFSNVLNTLTLTALLDRLTPFFSQLRPEIKSKFVQFVQNLILHHLQNLPCNSLALEEVKGQLENLGRPSRDPASIRTAKLEQFASGVYPTISLINHSCDPNVTRLTDSANGGQMSIVTLKSLKAGTPLFTSYTKSFFQDPLPERLHYLSENYHFDCACSPCTEKWPHLTDLLTLDPKFQCDLCRKPIRSNGQCSSKCRKKHKMLDVLAEFEQQLSNFYQTYELVVQNQPIEALEKLKPVLAYFESKVMKPSGKYLLVLETLKRALDLVVYF